VPVKAGKHPNASFTVLRCSVDNVEKSAEENDESDLTQLDIEEGEGLEEYQDIDEEAEVEEVVDEEDNIEEEGNEEEEPVSSQDMEHTVIVVAPRR
jgi:hypothetical protein